MTKQEFIDNHYWHIDSQIDEIDDYVSSFEKDLAGLIKEVQEDYLFCPYCGTKLEHELYTDANSKLICKMCESKNILNIKL